MNGYRTFVLYFVLIAFFTSCQSTDKSNISQQKKPNILLIVADDLGYGDISCYGGDIPTPHIDALARKGIRFTRFHTSPLCAPTRAMLLSGNDNHVAGIGAQGNQTEHFGYEGRLTDRIATIPEVLKSAGYNTYMSGKWHLGSDSLSDPSQRGFDQSFALIPGAGNHYSDQNVLGSGKSLYRENGKKASWPEGAYSTDFYTDKILSYLDSNDDSPFFVYAAYTSPHWPLQVDEKYSDQFKGQYDSGYEELREKRMKSLKELKIIPQNLESPPLHESVKPWNSLNEKQQKIEARKMELYAGMVSNLDENIGRLTQYLEDKNELENTFIIFMSDNGAAHRDFYYSENFKVLQEYYNDDVDRMGKEDSYVSYGPQWAEAGSAPFKYFKDYATEGGTNTTLIISSPIVKAKNEINPEYATVQDIAPTIFELANTSYPKAKNDLYPLKGESILPFLRKEKENIHSEDHVFVFEHFSHAMVKKRKWKIVNSKKPFDIKNFELFDLDTDISEQIDLQSKHPEKYAELIAEWEKYSKEVQLQFPTPGGDI